VEAARSKAAADIASASLREQEQKVAAVWMAVSDACIKIYKDDREQAMTNDTCIRLFLETGLPEE
jgi:hypothetical protein